MTARNETAEDYGIEKIRAEIDKMFAETAKLNAKTRIPKWFAPFTAGATLVGVIAALLGVLFKIVGG
jgi:hypothetical protein